MRRLQRRLDDLEAGERWWRAAVAGIGPFTGQPDHARRQLKWAQDELAAAEERPRELLEPESEPTEERVTNGL